MSEGKRTTLVTGGARSGKSLFAQDLVESMGPGRVFLATGQAFDAEMDERIRRHQADRGAGWETVEEPLDIIGFLQGGGATGRPVLVDCLTLWVSNLMFHHGEETDLQPIFEQLALTVQRSESPVVLVTNEVGLGIVPDNALARRFRDNAGWLNQRLGRACEGVVLCVAGIPLTIKSQTIQQQPLESIILNERSS